MTSVLLAVFLSHVTCLQGGINAGLLATVWINRGRAVSHDQAIRPTYILNSIAELPNLINKFHGDREESTDLIK